MKIGILGGTFDPIHTGHLTLARAAQARFDLSKVLFIPAFAPPHKSKTEIVAEAHHRLRMVEIAVRSEPFFEASDIEIRRQRVSYTVETLCEIKRLIPQSDLYLVLGQDSFAGLRNWHEFDKIQAIVHFLVAPRRMEQSAIKPDFHAPFEWIPMEIYPASASMIRERIQRGEDVRSWLPAGVWDYMESMGIYHRKPSCPSR